MLLRLNRRKTNLPSTALWRNRCSHWYGHNTFNCKSYKVTATVRAPGEERVTWAHVLKAGHSCLCISHLLCPTLMSREHFNVRCISKTYNPILEQPIIYCLHSFVHWGNITVSTPIPDTIQSRKAQKEKGLPGHSFQGWGRVEEGMTISKQMNIWEAEGWRKQWEQLF